jgi:NADPH:quinone reductase
MDNGLQLRTLVTEGGDVELSLASVPVTEPGPDEVVVRVEAAPINPSDLGLLLAGGAADQAVSVGTSDAPVARVPLPDAAQRAARARVGQSMPAGNEGAGVVIGAGASPAAQALVGRTVALLGGAMYSQFRTVRVDQCLPLPEGVSAAQGASSFVNPLTALGMIGTMRAEGHSALVHTAAASNLGRMLNRLCRADGIDLVNIVRRPEQAELLRSEGAAHVCDSSADDFHDRLVDALRATGATIAFDAIGGGRLVSDILACMETAVAGEGGAFQRYGSSVHKQVYVYGSLDRGPTELRRSYGMAWGIGGWLLTPFLVAAGPDEVERLRRRVADEITTTFASGYTATVTLAGMIDPAAIADYGRQATGSKYLVAPNG